MTNNQPECFNCKRPASINLHGFAVCSGCESQLKLMTEATIKRHKLRNPAFEQVARTKLKYLEKDYARKKIKLLHILEGLKRL